MNNQRYDLDLWEEVIEKAVDTKAKASLQLPSKTNEINFKHFKNYKPSAKKEKTKLVKSTEMEIKIRLSYTIPILLTQISLKPRLPKKNKRHKNC